MDHCIKEYPPGSLAQGGGTKLKMQLNIENSTPNFYLQRRKRVRSGIIVQSQSRATMRLPGPNKTEGNTPIAMNQRSTQRPQPRRRRCHKDRPSQFGILLLCFWIMAPGPLQVRQSLPASSLSQLSSLVSASASSWYVCALIPGMDSSSSRLPLQSRSLAIEFQRPQSSRLYQDDSPSQEEAQNKEKTVPTTSPNEKSSSVYTSTSHSESSENVPKQQQHHLHKLSTIVSSSHSSFRPSQQPYNFWEEEELSITSFNMDLHNLAMDDPQRAQDALEIMSELYAQDPNKPMVVRPDSASYTAVIEGWCYHHHSHKHLQYQDNHGNGHDNANIAKDTYREAKDRASSSHSNSNSTESGGGNSLPHYAAHKAQALLDKMESTCATEGWLCPNDLSYLLVCQQWAESYKNDIMGANAQKAHDILIRLQEQEQRLLTPPPPPLRPAADDNSNNTIEHVGDETASSSSSLSSSPTTQPVVANVKFYVIVLEGWCRRVGKVRHAMQKAEQVLREMEEASLTIQSTTSENESYNATANLSSSTSSSMLNDTNNKSAEEVSATIAASTGSRTSKVRPNVLTYTSVIGALAKSRERNMASHAHSMIERMRHYGVEPDMVAYTSVLNCWAKAVSREERGLAAKKALEILKEMENLYILEEQYHVKPNAITYATAIKAIGNSLDPEAPALAKQVLQRMYELTESGTIHVPPTAGTYNSVITSLSSSRGCSPAQKLANAKRAEHLLVDMIKRSRNQKETAVEPNVRTWGAVLRAWAESGQPDAGAQAQRVLDQLQEWYDQGKTLIRPNVVCFTTVMNAWGRGQHHPQHDPILAMEKVDELLRSMEDLYEETLDPDVRPNKISYVTAIDAICRNCPKGKTGSKAQEIVDRMMRLYSKGIGHDRPTRIVLNGLLNAWSRSTEPNAAAKAEQIFQWMETQYRAGDDYVKPDEVSLCCVLNAWANAAQQDPGAALRAQQILDHTESLTAEERGFCHTIICHNIVIKAWGRSRAPDAVQRAQAILKGLDEKGNDDDDVNPQRREQHTIRPDVTTYSSVINCCAYYVGSCEGREAALEVALETFEKTLQQQKQWSHPTTSWNDTTTPSSSTSTTNSLDGKYFSEAEDGPNHITYGTLFKAIGKLLEHNSHHRSHYVGVSGGGGGGGGERHWSKNELVEHYFRQCCEHGYVDGFVLSQVKTASTFELYRKLVLLPAARRSHKSQTGHVDRDRGFRQNNHHHLNSIDALLKRLPSEWTRNVAE